MTTKTFHILLVDDEAFLRRTFATLLKRSGHSVTTVENGQEAVDFLESHVADLVIMDLDMPVLNGFDAARQIRARERAQNRHHTPMFSLTGRHDTASHTLAREAGFDAVYAKPIPFPELLERIQQHADTGALPPSERPTELRSPNLRVLQLEDHLDQSRPTSAAILDQHLAGSALSERPITTVTAPREDTTPHSALRAIEVILFDL